MPSSRGSASSSAASARCRPATSWPTCRCGCSGGRTSRPGRLSCSATGTRRVLRSTTTPRRSGSASQPRASEPWTAGPFFDDGGANIHLVTVSAPVLVGGRAIGVAAADMAVDQIPRAVPAGARARGSEGRARQPRRAHRLVKRSHLAPGRRRPGVGAGRLVRAVDRPLDGGTRRPHPRTHAHASVGTAHLPVKHRGLGQLRQLPEARACGRRSRPRPPGRTTRPWTGRPGAGSASTSDPRGSGESGRGPAAGGRRVARRWRGRPALGPEPWNVSEWCNEQPPALTTTGHEVRAPRRRARRAAQRREPVVGSVEGVRGRAGPSASGASRGRTRWCRPRRGCRRAPPSR